MEEYLEEVFGKALKSLGVEGAHPIRFETPQNSSHGDLSTNVAMTIAKRLGKSPRDLAKELISNLDIENPAIEAVDIAGPGFINIRFSKRYLAQELYNLLEQDEDFGSTAANLGKSINVEWVSANPTGNLHAGHGRQVALGASIANLLEWTGAEVTREYYFNNAGNQMRNLAESVRVRYLQELGEAVLLGENGYQGAEIVAIAKKIVSNYGETKRDAPLEFFQSFGEQENFRNIQATLKRLDVAHDIFFNENSLYESGAIKDVVERFLGLGLAYEKDGATWLALSKMGEPEDRVIIRSNGEPTYRLPDICYHIDKLTRGYDYIIDIFGADHIATISDVQAALRALDYPSDRIKVIIHQMVSFIADGELIKFSKRSGDSYTLDELLDDVGTDAAKFFFNMRAAGSHLEFDVELAKERSEKNPVYYVQYAHARIASILRFAEQEGIELEKLSSDQLSVLTHAEEIALIKILIRFPQIVARSASAFAPHHICEYLREVAAQYHKFYHECRIVQAPEEIAKARLALCSATKLVLANGCAILGVTAPESM